MRGSFEPGYLERLPLEADVVRSVRLLGEYKGKQELFKRQSPQALQVLREVASVQSIESSNRIEGVVAPPERVADLAADKTTPRDRSEQEIAGYRDVLAAIHASASDMRLSVGLVLQLHRDLMRYTPATDAGVWKDAPNDIVDRLPDGTHRLRFSPVAPHLVEETMSLLVEGFTDTTDAATVDPLVSIPAFVLDFLCIHPFRDGNGRLARLLNLLLLYQAGYEVGRFVSLEKLVEQSKESYYDALEESSYDWHEGEHDLRPWLEYSLGILLAAYREFEDRVGHMKSGRGAKREMVIECIRHLPSTFRYADIERACPGISRPTIVRVLGELRDSGEIRRRRVRRSGSAGRPAGSLVDDHPKPARRGLRHLCGGGHRERTVGSRETHRSGCDELLGGNSGRRGGCGGSACR
jgi:Fic family protein